MKWRIRTLIIVFGLFFSFLVFNIYNIQFWKNGFYLNFVKGNDVSSRVSQIERGGIFFTDKNSNAVQVALNKNYPVIYAVPDELQNAIQKGEVRIDIAEVAAELGAIVGRPADALEKQLSKKKDEYELLLSKASDDQMSRVQELKIKGIYSKYEILRFYPFLGLAAQLLGFVSPINQNEVSRFGSAEIGRYGVELYFNDKLGGSGDDVFLTIDRNIQSRAGEILTDLVKKYDASGGTVIVEEPETGKIVALANYPDFDPNDYSKSEIEKFLNPATQAVYEPGSIFKLITMATGIDSGKITPTSTYIDTGFFTANGKTITNWDFKTHGAYGKTTMTNVIEHSINTGAVFAERQFGHEIFYNYLVKFGLGQLSGITLPGEVRGSISNVKKGRDIDFATAAYGQGVSVTPLQLINAISVVANGGVLMKPYILREKKPEVVRRVIKEETAKEVTRMMVSAVDKNVLAAIPDYKVAGKTGTAFVPDFATKKGYTNDVINTYVGFAPASNPKFVVSIKLDKPAGSPLAGQTVVPAFRDLTQFILNYYNIAPDNLTISH